MCLGGVGGWQYEEDEVTLNAQAICGARSTASPERSTMISQFNSSKSTEARHLGSKLARRHSRSLLQVRNLCDSRRNLALRVSLALGCGAERKTYQRRSCPNLGKVARDRAFYSCIFMRPCCIQACKAIEVEASGLCCRIHSGNMFIGGQK